MRTKRDVVSIALTLRRLFVSPSSVCKEGQLALRFFLTLSRFSLDVRTPTRVRVHDSKAECRGEVIDETNTIQ